MKLKQYTLLHYACSGGDIDIFNFVFDQCKDLKDVLTNNSENRTGETPLHWAVACNNFDIVKSLVAKQFSLSNEMKRDGDQSEISTNTAYSYILDHLNH